MSSPPSPVLAPPPLAPTPPANAPKPLAPRKIHAAFPHPVSFSWLPPYPNPAALGCCFRSKFFLEGFSGFHQLEAASSSHSSLYLHCLMSFISLTVCAHRDVPPCALHRHACMYVSQVAFVPGLRLVCLQESYSISPAHCATGMSLWLLSEPPENPLTQAVMSNAEHLPKGKNRRLEGTPSPTLQRATSHTHRDTSLLLGSPQDTGAQKWMDRVLSDPHPHSSPKSRGVSEISESHPMVSLTCDLRVTCSHGAQTEAS